MCTGDQATGAELSVGVYRWAMWWNSTNIGAMWNRNTRSPENSPAHTENKGQMEPVWDKSIIEVNVFKHLLNPVKDP